VFVGATIAAALALGIVAFAFPHTTKAFWPFGAAAQADSTAPIVTDSSLVLLAAATNTDPNPNKGGQDLALTGGSALIAEAGPEGSVPDIAHIPEATAISTYTVQDGDTLSGIADRFNVSVNTILWANDLTVKSTIKPGQTLTILPVTGIEHTVVEGETLASLAKKYGADATEVATYNGLSAGAALPKGSKIIIPGGELTTSASATATKSSSASKSSSSSTVPGNTTGNPYRGGSGAEYDGYYANPVPGAILTQGLHGENGVDLGIAKGTPIHAAADGTVIVAKSGGGYNGGYGNYVVLSHANGSQTLYAHMTAVSVAVGQKVSQGTVIGTVGVTGDATGPHLHFEVRGARNPFVASINAGLCKLNKVCLPK
jgi:murein DD-endopeptidase MepM/ murein hydrolase activator NlpD